MSCFVPNGLLWYFWVVNGGFNSGNLRFRLCSVPKGLCEPSEATEVTYTTTSFNADLASDPTFANPMSVKLMTEAFGCDKYISFVADPSMYVTISPFSDQNSLFALDVVQYSARRVLRCSQRQTKQGLGSRDVRSSPIRLKSYRQQS